MKWKKSPPELIEKFDASVPGPPAVRRSMFGYPAAFVNGNMFMGLHQSDMVLRLSPKERQEFLQLTGARLFEPMPGRPMREYVVVPPAVLLEREKLTEWVTKALEYGGSLKPKEKKFASRKPKPEPNRGSQQRKKRK